MSMSRNVLLVVLCLAESHVQAGVTGHAYTNFGVDLTAPVLPHNGTLAFFSSKSDKKPFAVMRDTPVVSIIGDAKACLQTPADGWVKCQVSEHTGWVRREDFLSGADVTPVTSWPFRYWFLITAAGTSGEEGVELLKIMPRVPYLTRPQEFDNVFFHVKFDEHGVALSPKDGKPTGDSVFVIDNAVYLAPSEPAKRRNSRWLFLGYHHPETVALCPGKEPASCMSAVNLAPGWKGITALYTQPSARFAHKDTEGPWSGPGEVAFARHADPVRPLLYRVPDTVDMAADRSNATDAERSKNRAKPFCIADCGGIDARQAPPAR